MKRTLLALAVLATATAAHADNRRGFYIGGGANYIDLKVSSAVNTGDIGPDLQLDSPGSIGVAGLELYGGYKFNSYIGGELRVGTGLAESSETTNNYTIVQIAGAGTPETSDDVFETQLASSSTRDFSVSHFVSTYYRVESANQVAKLYGLLGFSSVTLSADNGASSDSETYNGLSYGAGLGFVLSPRGNLNFEYKRLVDDGDFGFDVLSVNYDFRF